MIELVGAGAYASRPIGELSGGEQQRLLIAQALVRRPALLLLDEPLDSLDLRNQAAVAGLVQRICRSQGVTVMLVAHDVNPILGYLDRVVYFAGGRGVWAPRARSITGPTLSRLYGSPIEVLEASDGRLVVVGTPDAAGPPPRSPRPCTLSWPASPGTWSPTSTADRLPVHGPGAAGGDDRRRDGRRVGWFMVLRRQTFAGHTLAVIAFPGAAGADPGRAPGRDRLLRRLRAGGAGALAGGRGERGGGQPSRSRRRSAPCRPSRSGWACSSSASTAASWAGSSRCCSAPSSASPRRRC